MNPQLAPTLTQLKPQLEKVFALASRKASLLHARWDNAKGSPVFTLDGLYASRGWTEWTQGFQFGLQILLYDVTGEKHFLSMVRNPLINLMARHVTHIGVHDHGFNNVSTYGNIRRLIREGRIDAGEWQMKFCELALKASGAVQAARWTSILDDEGRRDAGFIHSFNGPHSLFCDTTRSVRSLCLAWKLGHELLTENDQPVNLLHRAIEHLKATSAWNVYFGEGRDIYDTPDRSGRVAHESIFNITDGRFRCPSTQQGYSPFSTWTRGLAWVLLGFAEQYEFFLSLSEQQLAGIADKSSLLAMIRRTALAAADFYLRHSFADGMVYWDTGAPAIPLDLDYNAPSNPFNDHEPIDSSAAAIAAQGFWRLSRCLAAEGEAEPAERYAQAARLIAGTLFGEPYLSVDTAHEGLILHSIYHRPRGWDQIPPGRAVPCSQSSMWGDYHALELALLLHRQIAGHRHPTFF